MVPKGSWTHYVLAEEAKEICNGICSLKWNYWRAIGHLQAQRWPIAGIVHVLDRHLIDWNENRISTSAPVPDGSHTIQCSILPTHRVMSSKLFRYPIRFIIVTWQIGVFKKNRIVLELYSRPGSSAAKATVQFQNVHIVIKESLNTNVMSSRHCEILKRSSVCLYHWPVFAMTANSATAIHGGHLVCNGIIIVSWDDPQLAYIVFL